MRQVLKLLGKRMSPACHRNSLHKPSLGQSSCNQSPCNQSPFNQSWGQPLQVGFTLIELLIAVAIMAIVAGVSIPIYTAYADRSYRSEAQADLALCAQGMERWASNNFDYLGAADTNADGVGDANTGPPATQVCQPRSVANGRYTFTVTGTATTFNIRATPVGQMVGDGFVTIDQAGARGWDENNNGSIGAGEDTWEH